MENAGGFSVRLTLTIDRDGEDYEVEAEVTYHPPCRGARDSPCGIRGAGPPLEPDEDASIEIETVWHDGEEIECDKETTRKIEEAAWDLHNSDRDFE